jgi:formate dehydrogenase subunit gamma
MVNRYDPSIATQIINGYEARPEMLVQILHEFVTRFAYICDQAIVQIADELNLSRADVHGVVSFYHDFRTRPPGKRVLKICQAESCQAMGSRSLTAHAQEILGIAMNETSGDGETTLEPVYCLGNCACSPAVMLDGKVYGRVDGDKLDALLEGKGARG